MAVGLLIDRLDDDYQNAVLRGIVEATREKGVSLYCFTGGVLRGARRPGAERNAVYDLISAESVDGLLIMAGALGNTIGMAELSRHCERYRPLPICSIAVAIDSFPSVLIDNMSGMWSGVAHLVRAHGLRRIAFIRGPDANSEAERRYRVYRDVLTEHEIALNPSLVVAGDFTRAAGADAVRVLLDERRADIDAIVAANDNMALGAIEALHARGKRVPEDVAVVGFDDVEEARLFTPPLSTVRQPLHEQGRRATHILLERIDGRTGPERVILRTELVTRRSCGCLRRPLELASDDPSGDGAKPPASMRETIEASLAHARDEILSHMTKASRQAANEDTAWAARLMDAFLADLADPAGSTFLATFDGILRAEALRTDESAAWQDVLSAMRRRVLARIPAGHLAAPRAEDLFHEARAWHTGFEAQAQARQRLIAMRRARVLGEIGTALITAFDIETLISSVTQGLPRLGIASSYLSLYEGDRTPADMSRLILALDTSTEGASRSASADITFPSKKLAPDGVLPVMKRMEFVVEPLFFKEEQLGFILFEMGPRQGAVYEILRDQLSAALKGALLVKQVAEKDKEQRRLLVDIEKRSFQLDRAQEALKENQAKLGTARSAAKEAMRLASSAAERASNLGRTSRFPPPPASAPTREAPTSEPRIIFNAVPCVRETITLLGSVLRQAGCKVFFDPASEIVEIAGPQARFSQAISNLIMNAVDGILAREGGQIAIQIARIPSGVELTVSDTGAGVSPELIPKLFDPPPTLRGFGPPSSLGLSVVHEIITAELRGTISVESRLGSGTTFTIHLPPPTI